MTRLKYDGLAEGTHTFTFDEKLGPEGQVLIVGQPRIEKGDVVEVEDLNDPKSERARICRGHIERGVAHVIGEKPKKEAGQKN